MIRFGVSRNSSASHGCAFTGTRLGRNIHSAVPHDGDRVVAFPKAKPDRVYDIIPPNATWSLLRSPMFKERPGAPLLFLSLDAYRFRRVMKRSVVFDLRVFTCADLCCQGRGSIEGSQTYNLRRAAPDSDGLKPKRGSYSEFLASSLVVNAHVQVSRLRSSSLSPLLTLSPCSRVSR